MRTYPPTPNDSERAHDIKEYYLLKNGTSREIVEQEIEARRNSYNLSG